MRSVLAAVALLAVGALQSQAAVYTFTPIGIGPTTVPFYSVNTPAFSITIDDQTVRLGSFTYDVRYKVVTVGNPPQAIGQFVSTGDVQALQNFSIPAGFVSFSAGQYPGATSSDFFRANLLFTPDGAIDVAAISFGNDNFGLEIAGSGESFNGLFNLGTLPTDTVAGTFTGALPEPTAVPEPSTFAIVGFLFAAIGIRHRHASFRTTTA